MIRKNFILTAVLLSSFQAFAKITLSKPGDGAILDKMVGWFQFFIDFVSGPGALIIGVVLIIAGGAMLLVDPRETWLKWVLRIIGLLIIILNIGLIITTLKLS